ncbi:MAG: rRNA cytosine-C5-methyltransferase [Bacteroidaceae bacterium]|nr:rRNA cytosine-C5-methyltransferase [Bacteroidaceae bacterium]
MKQIPNDFIQQMDKLIGQDETNALVSALGDTTATTSIRHNARKLNIEAEVLFPEAQTSPVGWCAKGVYLSDRPSFVLDPIFHAGGYYVQEAASMFIEQAYLKIAGEHVPNKVLDLCAAPGGKSTLWRSLLPDGALLVANEPIRQRADILAENLLKWGHPDVVVTNAYPHEFSGLNDFFDVIAADVPCSGEGMFRKDDTAISEWSLQNVADCVARQWKIVCDVWDCLREGGYMVYSTCTFNADENENMIANICNRLGAEIVPLPVQAEWNISTLTPEGGVKNAVEQNNGMYHFYPHKTRGEGLFLCLLRKTSEAPALKIKKDKTQKQQQVLLEVKKTLTWLRNPNDFALISTDDGQWSAVKKQLAEDMILLRKQVRCLANGIPLAESKGKKMAPQHGLALSTERSDTAFPTVEVDLPTAIAYLRHEAITIEAPKGWVIVTYKHLPLGFVNNLGTRANNMYPQVWRIRKSV